MAKKLFGTDGIRGRANTFPMTASLALKLGQAAAQRLDKGEDKKLKVIIGKDTRLSGYIFEFSLTAGLCSLGADVYLVGPMPTPAIAHLTRSFAADFGIVISASHNPAEDNGIKFFDRRGYKLPDSVENEIESLVFGSDIDASHVAEPGKAYRIADAIGRYIEFAKGSIGNASLHGLKVVIDCANGAAYKVAPLIFSELGAEVIAMNKDPDGMNINKECGAVHPERLRQEVLNNTADLGIALDGDADRVILVDEAGNIVDGDYIMAIAAQYMKTKDKLKKNTVVVTVMSNLGLEKSLASMGIHTERTKVGDRYVIEQMIKGGYSLGGEQSGHIIFGDINSTGDGTIAALQIANIMKERNVPLSELCKCMVPYPQRIENISVKEKKPIDRLPLLSQEIKKAESELGDAGRLLIRYSGTENKLRIMVEAMDLAKVNRLVKSISDAAREELG